MPSADLGFKEQPLLEAVHDFDILLCRGEWEALLAENRLIKGHPAPLQRPPDRRQNPYPYLVVATRDFPRVFVAEPTIGDDRQVAAK
ncbi:MAG: hypothetical protein R3B68_05820 [Phycisphaerales bacterium]